MRTVGVVAAAAGAGWLALAVATGAAFSVWGAALLFSAAWPPIWPTATLSKPHAFRVSASSETEQTFLNFAGRP